MTVAVKVDAGADERRIGGAGECGAAGSIDHLRQGGAGGASVSGVAAVGGDDVVRATREAAGAARRGLAVGRTGRQGHGTAASDRAAAIREGNAAGRRVPVTVAVKVTLAPTSAGLAELATAAVLVALFTVCVSVLLVEPLLLASPPYVATMLCVPALRPLVLQVAVLELAEPAGNATAPQPVKRRAIGSEAHAAGRRRSGHRRGESNVRANERRIGRARHRGRARRLVHRLRERAAGRAIVAAIATIRGHDVVRAAR